MERDPQRSASPAFTTGTDVMTIVAIGDHPSHFSLKGTSTNSYTPPSQPLVGEVFWVDLAGKLHGPSAPTAGIMPESLIRRIAFFSRPSDLPFLLAPVLLRELWSQASGKGFVLSYPKVADEQALSAAGLLSTGCDAVLMTSDSGERVVLGLARTAQNEKLINHWADVIEEFASSSNDQNESELAVGPEIVDFVCHRVEVIRVAGSISGGHLPTPTGDLHLLSGSKVNSFLKSAVRQFFARSEALYNDPFASCVAVLNQPSEYVIQDEGTLVTNLMFWTWSARADLQAAFDLSSVTGRNAFVKWFLTRAPIETGIGREFLHPLELERAKPTRSTATESLPVTKDTEDAHTLHGVNLVGYPRAEMGMGEHVRLTASALLTTDVPFGIINFNFGIIASQSDTRYDHLITSGHPFDVNLFHINADQMRLAYDRLGGAFFRGAYNIGYWAWELSEFPDAWLPSIGLVDEIWAPSKFIQEAIARKTKKPVVWMPLAVEFPVPEQPRREAFGLPSEPYLFLFFFDFSSFATRKNALACVECFQRAFPSSDSNVGLVIKTIRHSRHRQEFWKLIRQIGDDSRIRLIDRVLTNEEIHELTACCDCFVSLHRSEGFGRGLAEAMYLEKPVIATGYSGNVDFTNRETSCLVDYALVPVKQTEYVYPEGQVWADPDIDQAADYMRRLVRDRSYGQSLGQAAAKLIRQQHNCRSVGARYAARVEQIHRARQVPAFPSTDLWKLAKQFPAAIRKRFSKQEAAD